MLEVDSLRYIRLVVAAKTLSFGLISKSQLFLSYQISLKTHTLEINLTSISPIPLDLYSANLNLTLYCEDIVGTVSVLRQFASLAVFKTLVRN